MSFFSNILKLAWRNLWRNKRRTLITITSILFAVFFSLVMRSMQKGSYSNMVDNVVGAYWGYVQVHARDYWDKKTIEESLDASAIDGEMVERVNNVKAIVPRLESFALASSGNITKGVMLTGIDPRGEDAFSHLSNKLIQGVLLAEKLASYLKLSINDTLVMISQGYHGVSAAGKYPVRGILRFPNPELNKSVVYMNLLECQNFYGAENRLTSYVVLLERHSPGMILRTKRQLTRKLGGDYEVMTWGEMLPQLVQIIESDNASGWIMLGILYMVIAFGILGTVMMMTSERMREFGVMVAVGMQRGRLAMMVFVETVILGFIGIIAGTIISIPVVYYMHLNPIRLTGEAAMSMESFGVEPIIPFAWESSFFISQAIIVLVIALATGLYPVGKLMRIEPVIALRP